MIRSQSFHLLWLLFAMLVDNFAYPDTGCSASCFPPDWDWAEILACREVKCCLVFTLSWKPYKCRCLRESSFRKACLLIWINGVMGYVVISSLFSQSSVFAKCYAFYSISLALPVESGVNLMQCCCSCFLKKDLGKRWDKCFRESRRDLFWLCDACC